MEIRRPAEADEVRVRRGEHAEQRRPRGDEIPPPELRGGVAHGLRDRRHAQHRVACDRQGERNRRLRGQLPADDRRDAEDDAHDVEPPDSDPVGAASTTTMPQ